MSTKQKKSYNFPKIFTKIAFGFGIAGLITLIMLIVFLWNNYSIVGNKKIDMGATGQFGDYVGGVVGTLWAGASVILLYLTLRSQNIGLQESRKEHSINRISNFIYKEVELVEKSTGELEYVLVPESEGSEGITLKGRQVISYLSNFTVVYNELGTQQQEKFLEMNSQVTSFLSSPSILGHLTILENSIKLFKNLAEMASNSTTSNWNTEDRASVRLLYITHLNVQESIDFCNGTLEIIELIEASTTTTPNSLLNIDSLKTRFISLRDSLQAFD